MGNAHNYPNAIRTIDRLAKPFVSQRTVADLKENLMNILMNVPKHWFASLLLLATFAAAGTLSAPANAQLVLFQQQ